MDDDVTLIAMLRALGVRAVRIPDLPEPGIGIRKHGLLLLNTDLTRDHRADALEWALRQVRQS